MSDPTEAPRRSAERGLAAERTALAWRRTLLSFMAAALVAMQTLPSIEGTRALALSAAVALALTPSGWWFAKRHARHTAAHLQHQTPRLRHGRRIVVICVATSTLGAGGLGLVLLA